MWQLRVGERGTAQGGPDAVVRRRPLTLTSVDAIEAAQVPGAAEVVPLHSGLGHFSEKPDTVRAAFEAAGSADRLVPLEPGERAEA